MFKDTLRLTRASLLSCWLLSPPALFAQDASDADISELEEFSVVTTGTRSERLISEVPIKTELLGKEAFESAAVFELGQALELLNGARTEANCQNCGTAEIQLLGLPGNYNQILVDGLPLFTGVASVYGIDQVPTIFVDRIEVVKGGGSALYGPGAVAGVINLIPEEPFDSHSHVETLFRDIDGSSSYQGQFASFLVSDDQSIKASIYGLYGDQDPYDVNNDGFTELVERDNQTVGTYLWWTPNERTRLRFNYQYIGEERRGGDRLDIPNQFAQISEYLDTEYHWATLRWDQEVNEDFSLNLAVSGVSLNRDSFYGGTGGEYIHANDTLVDAATRTYNRVSGDASASPGTDAARAFALFGDAFDGSSGGSFNQFGDLSSESLFIDAQFNYDLGHVAKSGRHRLVFGFQYETEDLRDDNINADGQLINILQDASFENFGVYLQDEWQISPKLEVVPGIRIDKTNTLDDVIWSPRIAARWSATDELTLRANYSTGFLAPRVFSEDTHVDNLGGQPVDTVNAEGLTEERSRTFALGFEFHPSSLGGKLTTGLQAYYTELEDSFFIEEPGNNPVIENGRVKVERTNTDGTSVIGAEWDFAYQFSEHWILNTGLAYNETRFDTAQEIFDGVSSRRYNKTPDWSGLAQINYDNDALFDAYLALKWTGSMEVARNTTEDIANTPEFTVIDFGLSKSFKLNKTIDLTIRAGINNILDEYQEDLETGAERDSDYVYGPRYPRTYTLGARLDF
ncbi:MAG: TonB-dependent receptor plug domain-containing protein [Opitutales bacterium]